jgi:nucleoside transporter
MSENKSAIYPRLCLAYFMQFAIWGSWGVALGGFAGGTLGLKGTQVGWLYLAMPIGAIISPLFIGPIADRYFSAQKVIALLHALSGVALLFGGFAGGKESFALLMLAMLLHGICFTPTIGLVNAIVFKHLPKASNAPYVFVFGTFGWIVVNLVISGFLGGFENANFLFAGGIISIALAGYCLTLPDTPPKGAAEGEGKGDALGLGALAMLKEPAFAIFVICAFIASIPACNFFFPILGNVLNQRGYPAPLALGTLCQISELLFMTALPFFVLKFGLKKVVIIGMVAWALRYVAFAQWDFSYAVIGLLLHGFCYSFLYVGAYMYGEKVAPDHLKASVQSLLTFLLIGVGQAVGAYWGGMAMEANPAPVVGIVDAELLPDSFLKTDGDGKVVEPAAAAMPGWSNPDENKAWGLLDLSGQFNKILGKGGGEATEVKDLSTEIADGDSTITLAEIRAISEDGVTIGDKTYTAADVEQTFRAVAAVGTDDPSGAKLEDVSVTREDWLKVQATGWDKVFIIPAMFLLVICGIFAVAGKDPKDEEVAAESTDAETPAEEAAPEAPSEE